MLLRHARPQGRSSPGATESSFACARVTSYRAETEDRRGAGNILPTAWGQTVEGGAAPRKGSVAQRWKAPRVRLSVLTFAGESAKRPFLGTPAAAGTGTHVGARASASEVDRGRRVQPRLWRARRLRTALVTVRDRRCSSRSGWGQAPPASDRGGRGCAGAGIAAPTTRPLTRGTSAGQLARARWAIRSPERARKGAPPGEKLHQRATAGVVLRSSDIRGRARGSFRLQKSTGGARHRSLACEERADPNAA